MSPAEIANLLAGMNQNTSELTAVLAELGKISGSMAEQDSRTQRYVKEILDSSPIFMRSNMYRVYSYLINAAVSRKLLANVWKDFGEVAANRLICLNQGGSQAVTSIFLNAPGNDPILISNLINVREGIRNFDIQNIFYEVTTSSASTDPVRLLVGAWVKGRVR